MLRQGQGLLGWGDWGRHCVLTIGDLDTADLLGRDRDRDRDPVWPIQWGSVQRKEVKSER